ncbi:MAG: hypothetical protein AAF587_30545 [Bacteroidota bacterium]
MKASFPINTTPTAILLISLFFILQSFQMRSTHIPSPLDASTFIEVIEIPEFGVGETQTITDNINKGATPSSLEWAAQGSVACFPGTRFVEFQGKQVFYSVRIPRGSELIVSLTPSSRKRINLFGYIDFHGDNVPPIASCRSCESSYPIYAGKPNLRDGGGKRKISFSHAVNRSFTALIAVSGAQGVEEGEYELSFELKSR